jgi:hypothetical protein
MRNSILIIDNNTEKEKIIKAHSPTSKVTTIKWEDAIGLDDSHSFAAVFIATDTDRQLIYFIPILVKCFPAYTIVEWRNHSTSEEVLIKEIPLMGLKLFLLQVNNINVGTFLTSIEIPADIRAADSLRSEFKITPISEEIEKNPKSDGAPITTSKSKITTIRIESRKSSITVFEEANKSARLQNKTDGKTDKVIEIKKSSTCIIC